VNVKESGGVDPRKMRRERTIARGAGQTRERKNLEGETKPGLEGPLGEKARTEACLSRKRGVGFSPYEKGRAKGRYKGVRGRPEREFRTSLQVGSVSIKKNDG